MDGFAGDAAELARKLANIQAITDEALAHMDVDELLDTLLERVREILGVDTATVLLLDRQARRLVATATRGGLEEEVTQDVRIPLGRGFAGRVAAERRPIHVHDVASADIVNPLITRSGLRSLLGVPLIEGGSLVGVMHVGTRRERHFTAEETELLQMAAARAATAVRSLAGQAERAGAMELQRSLIPSTPPAIPGVEVAARYRPGKASVGGDWYDVFGLPSGRFGIVMGDVAGHGFGAAVVMGRLRSTLRAYALISDDPAEVLGRVDRKMAHFEPDATATVLYAVYDPADERITVSSAGHFAPVLAVPGETPRPVDIKPGILIGLGEAFPRPSATLGFPAGSLLCLYTDGLVERRGVSINHGILRLCEALYAGPAEQVGAAVMAELVGLDRAEDDIAMLLLRRIPG